MSKIYTTLKDPTDLRKHLLSANIGVIELMEDLENLKELRSNKHHTFLFLKAYMKEITSSINGLRNRFPHLKNTEEEELKKEAENINIEFKGYVKDDKEINKLEREMFILREKLKDIS